MNDKNLPDFETASYRDAQPKRQIVADARAGTVRVRAESKYLPPHEGEISSDYRGRRNRSVLFNAVARTIEGLVGMVMRRDLNLVDVPAQIDVTRIDGTRHLNVFTRDVLAEAIADGHACILVDAPRWHGTEPLNKREERELGIAPYFVLVKADQIINLRTERLGFREILSQVTIKEYVIEPDGPFGESDAQSYAVYRRVIRDGAPVVGWERWLRREHGDLLKIDDGIIANVSEIPLAVVYSHRTGVLQSEPPLLDLAYVNLAHYQVLADHLTALHMASLPVLVVRGAGIDRPVPIGPNVALDLPGDGDAKYIETSGHALGATRQQLKDFETQMARLGMSMLQHETRAAETAEAKRLDKAEQDSALASTARSLQDGVNQALAFAAQQLKLKDGGSVVVNRDFDRLTLNATEVREYSSLVANGQLSLETLWSILAEGGVLPDSFDPELERAAIDAEMLSLPVSV